MKYIFILFVFLFCTFSSSDLLEKVHSEKYSMEVGFLNIEKVIKEHLRYRSTSNSFSTSGQELSIMYVVPTRSYTSSCPKKYQKSYYLHKEWMIRYQLRSCQGLECNNKVINGIGASPAQCWNILNEYGHSMKWFRQIMKGYNKKGKDLYNKCPDGCSFYTTIIRYYTGQCKKEVSEALMYCGHKRSVNQWNINSFIININNKKPLSASLIQFVFDDFINYFD